MYFIEVYIHVYFGLNLTSLLNGRSFMKYHIPKPAPNPTQFDIKPLYGLPPEEAKAMGERMKWELDDAEYYVFLFRPKNKEIIKHFVPPPLKPLPRMPLINIFVQQLKVNGAKGNDSLNHGYLENILSTFVGYKGKVGMYPIAIHIESDIGAMIGREMFGTAKKIARIDYKKDGNSFSWKIRRRGITIIESRGEILKEASNPENVYKFIENPTFHLHQTIGPFSGPHYAYPPRLMSMQLGIRKVHHMYACDNVEMVFNESPFDPVCLLQPKDISAVSYLKADTKIVTDSIETLETLDSEEMLPYLFAKLDPF